MYQFLSKNGQTIAFGLGILLTAIFLISALGGIEQFDMLGKEEQYQTTIFDSGFWSVIILTIICFAAAVLFGLGQMLGNFKGALKGIIGIAALAAIFFIIYSSVDPTADSASVMKEVENFNVTDGQSKFISGALVTTIVLSLLALATFVVFEIINLFK
ncbi:MAG: hypothetical protein AAFO82_13030 [Bacteroidota bacterium]